MDMYGQQSASRPQKCLILVSEIALIVAAYFVLFGPFVRGLRAFGDAPNGARNATLLAFDLVVFVRLVLTLFVFLKRAIPWEEAASIPCAFAVYLLGFPLLARPANVGFGPLGIAGVVLFVLGSVVNTYAEYQRWRFKLRPENAGRLYTGGFFALSMHPNYFGDLLWVSGYACVTHNAFAGLVPIFLFCFFFFYNIPSLDQHLRQHYPDAFKSYEQRTKRLIPFIL